MIYKILAITFVVTVCLCCVGTLQAIELRVLSESAHDLKVTAIDGGWRFETTGPDPYIMTELRIDFGSISAMTIRLRNFRLCIRTAKEIESIANEEARTCQF